MRYLRFQLLAAALCLVCCLTNAANVLRVDTVRYPAGKAVSLPVVLENSSDITGVQFDISVPYQLDTDTDDNIAVQLSKTRAASHTVTTKYLGTEWRSPDAHAGISYYYKYRVIVYSDQNALLLDNQGTLLTLSLTTTDDLDNGAVLPVYLLSGSVTLSDRQKQNVLTSQVDGQIIIEEIPRPDLQPTDIATTETSVAPGGKLNVSWKVKNIGQVSTDDGWSEQITLVTVSGNLTKTIATTYYDQKLAAGAQVSRTAEIYLPALLGLDGVCQVQVDVVPTDKTGEHISLRDNNSATSTKNITISKLLTLELSRLNVAEGSSQRITAKLSRSGRWSNIRSFTITKSPDDARLSVPATATIQSNQSGTVFYIDVVDNDVVDSDSVVVLSVEGDGYDPVTARIVIEDNEYPELSVKASKSTLTEGETFNLTITAPRTSTEPTVVSIVSENTKRFKFPSTATIPAGQKSVTVTVETVDDELPNLEESNMFTVSAAKFSKGTATVLLKDNDMPVLALTVTPNQVGEGDGPTALAAILTRTGVTNNKITVKISDDSNGGLYYSNKSVEMAAGVESVHFNLGPVDNIIQEGDRTYTLTAAVWVQSCSCSSSGEQAGHVSAQIKVLDNDGPSLSVSAAAATVKEGASTTLTVSRNTTNTAGALTVSLKASDDTDISYPKTVTIPSGQQSATVTVSTTKNSISDDSRTVIFTVSSNGYASGTCFLLITDQTLPDARIESLTANKTGSVVGSTVTLYIKVVNDGAAPLPAGTTVTLYKQGSTQSIGKTSTKGNIAEGASETIERNLAVPEQMGAHVYYAVVNEQRNVKELVYTNNTSAELTIQATSPFTATAQTDKTVYKQGETVTVTGKLTGDLTANTDVEVYMINDGVRETNTTKTDALGNYTLEWQLYSLQSGHFVVGACFPSDPTTDAMAEFDVYGLKRADSGYITCDITVGEAYTGTVSLKNAGSLPLTGIKAVSVEPPTGCNATFSLKNTLAANETANLQYTLNCTTPSEGNDWQTLKVRITSTEGASLDVTILFYARVAKGNLVVDNQNLTTTMNKDNGRDYSFKVSNTGKGNTGKLSLSLPSWMSALTGATMPALNQNDTTTVVLRMMPTSDMQLNVPVTGRIGINCENGNGTYINFSVTPVSDVTGTLVIDVCDEYTYYTDEKPHVSGASVTLRNPVTGALIAEAVSGADGICSFTLPEGYYQVVVRADNHDTYKNTILVDPGVTTTKVVNLSYQAVSVSWDVVETEVEDEYNIVTTVTYETNVPTPVVECIMPDRVDADKLGEGESLVFYAVLTNKGLITSKNTAFRIPSEAGGYSWVPLSEFENIMLAPQQSVVIPIKVTRMAVSDSRMRKASDNDGCHTASTIVSEWECGPDGKYHEYKKTVQYRDCGSGATMNGGSETGSDGPGSPNGGSDDALFEYETHGVRVSGSDDCDFCNDKGTKTVTDCVLSFVPGGGGCAYGLTNSAATIASGKASTVDYITTGLTGLGCALEVGGFASMGTGLGFAPGAMATAIGIGINLLSCTIALIDACASTSSSGGNGYGGMPGGFSGAAGMAGLGGGGSGDNNGDSGAGARALSMRKVVSGEPSYMTHFSDISKIKLKELVGYYGYMVEVLGDTIWLYEASLQDMYNVMDAAKKQNGKLSMTSMKSAQPDGISDDIYQKFIDRYNNTLDFDATGKTSENMILQDEVRKYIDLINTATDEALALGYYSLEEMWNTESDIYREQLAQGHNSVCSTISLQISQTMTMTRQAFRGTLTVFNGNETTAMTDVKLRLTATNRLTGEVATSREFEIHAESLKGFEGTLDMESGWTLAGKATGTATILFIPSKFAAPESDIEYAFGGTLSYIDPYTGLEVHRDLNPVTLTVKPSPEIDLTYFMQRDLYGDDALTEAVEPVVPGEFAVILNNKGNGDATNVRMVTKQPEIIDNEKGLLIDFEFISSQLNGQEKTLAMGESIPTEFGTIPAHSQAYAQWWLQSSLLGHFIDYQIEATHVTSYGNENLSLLDQVTIHELIHGFTPSSSITPPVASASDGSPVGRAFLVNDVVDAYDLPDQIYFTDATQADVFIATNAIATKQTDTEYTLTVTPTQAGWNYGNVLDPTVGKQKLISVVRQRDNVVLPVDNVWQTDRTLVDGKDWLYENRLHFIGNMIAAGETYLLTFEPKPDVELQVEKIDGVPAEGTLQTTPLKEVTVTFNKPVKAETFTTADLSLACQGTQLDATKISITKVDDKTFKLNLTQLTTQNGYYVLTVQTAEITDQEGFKGAVGKQASWVQFSGGKVNIVIAVTPENSGTVNIATGQFDYGQTLSLTATPKTGYDFLRWTETLTGATAATTVGEETTLSYTTKGDATLTAVFQPKNYDVTITYDEKGGTVENGGSGKYGYGSTVTLTATPNAGYSFDGWKVNGTLKSTEPTLTITVSAATTVEAIFTELASAMLSGRVTSAVDDTPIAGATVTLISGDVAYSATTNTLGRYTISVTEKSLNYDLKCEAKGYMWSPDQTIWFTSGDQTKDFVLLRGATVRLPNDGIYTFSSAAALDFKQAKGIVAYYAPQLKGSNVVLSGINASPADAGLIVRSNAGDRRVDIPEATVPETVTANLLIGTAQAVYTVDRDDVYVLANGAQNLKVFSKAARGTKVPMSTAYLQTTTTNQSLGILWPGDVNGDGAIGIGDIVAITNVMAGITTDPTVRERADVNGDGSIGIGDIVAVTNIMAGMSVQ